MWSNVELVRERMQGPPVSTEVRSLMPMVSGYDTARANQTDAPIQHLSVLVRVAETVTQSLSLDHQLNW